MNPQQPFLPVNFPTGGQRQPTLNPQQQPSMQQQQQLPTNPFHFPQTQPSVQQQQQPPSKQTLGELVEINVGGRKYSTTLRILRSIPLFNKLKSIPTLQTRRPPSVSTTTGIFQQTVLQQPIHPTEFNYEEYLSHDSEGNLFVDLNGELFESILDWFRYERVADLSISHLNVKQLLRLKGEALFYGVQDLSQACAKRLEELGQGISSLGVNPLLSSSPPTSQIGVKPAPRFELLKLQMKNTNQSLIAVQAGDGDFHVIPDARVEFELAYEGHILIEYSIADSSGDYVICIDGVDQKSHPALSGIVFQELSEVKIIKFDYAMTQALSFVSPTPLKVGKHVVELKWRSYFKTAYNMQDLHCQTVLCTSKRCANQRIKYKHVLKHTLG
ncbi:hypothetical protein C9374_002963 [Naegleria lovaniensis]|uniref:Potassium channel tetramerisation-type BTB domain-containing protein n=1 Tax=Naegleria lovaniensis TaxID=51637 RepID=A0AA88GTG1_NAELO|nr:uncharacterized protein C9374_002963 [Naegleria lovaniensis]KAG2385814.1 hypothetical protein C9374_002963 [Naegleria lovaniensis]